jgi:hypothetical protein
MRQTRCPIVALHRSNGMALVRSFAKHRASGNAPIGTTAAQRLVDDCADILNGA